MSWISERIEMIKKKIVLGRALFAITCKNKHLPNELDKIIKNKISIVNNSIKREDNFFHELQYYEILKIEYGIDIQELKNIYEEQISYLYDLEDLLNKNQFSFGYKEHTFLPSIIDSIISFSFDKTSVFSLSHAPKGLKPESCLSKAR